MTKKYLIVIEETHSGYSAYSPDIDGCIATGKSKKEVEKNIHDAIEFHLEGIVLEGHKVPEPRSYSKTMEVAA